MTESQREQVEKIRERNDKAEISAVEYWIDNMTMRHLDREMDFLNNCQEDIKFLLNLCSELSQENEALKAGVKL